MNTLKPLWPLFIALILSAAGHSYFTITLPALGRELSFSDLESASILSGAALAAMLAAPLWGVLGEHWGRSTIIVIGLLASCIGLGLLGWQLAPSKSGTLIALGLFEIILTLRIAQALLSAGIQPGAQALIADLTDSASRARGMGLLGAAFGIGSLLGGTLASLTGSVNASLGLYAIAGLIGLSALLNCQLNNRSKTSARQPAPLAIKRLMPQLITTLLGLCGFSLLQAVTSWRLQDSFAFSSDQSVQFAGLLMVISTAAMIVSQLWLVGRLAWQPRRLIHWGAIAACAAMLAAALATKAQILLPCMALFGLGLGLLLPGNLAALSLKAGTEHQSRAAGINGIFQGIGLALGPVLGASLQGYWATLPYWLVAILGLVIWSLAKTESNRQPNMAHKPS